ncbi:BREX system Lon protease-like protein BrxL [Desulfobacterales bacterium HSG16]|nr:BREX system Lon protease-like protein BrxL [Desulfobacterales bacterium HSG16]
MNRLDQKINEHFPGLVVRKDLVKTVRGNAIVPTYVLEYLLGQYCATNDEVTIQTGITTVKDILRKHYVHRNEANMTRSEIARLGRLKIIDRVGVDFKSEKNQHEASFANLGISKVLIDADTVKKHKKLLTGGVWCIADIEYELSEEKGVSSWLLANIKPIQLSNFDFDTYTESRKQFSLDEWIDLLLQSIGFNPAMFDRRSKLIQLTRLIPFCERNYNLIELGPKGTGKSHIYSEFSPHGILISGGEVTVPKLFVNNKTGKLGLVGYWDTVAFDEFAGKQKRVDKALVDIMKNYMANKSFSRGVETLVAAASMVFVGNTRHTVSYMLKHSDLFTDLPDKFYDSAFLDRIHFYIPGWEVDIIRGEMFSDGYGFIVDYLAEALRAMRDYDYSDRYNEHFSLSSDISTRDRDSINKTFSGLMKILFPQGGAAKKDIEELLKFAIKGRKRVKDQLMRIDSTYTKVSFNYINTSGQTKPVTTLEEDEYPELYYKTLDEDKEETEDIDIKTQKASTAPQLNQHPDESKVNKQHLTFSEGQSGISFDNLFGNYLRGAGKLTITDPYIQKFYQIRNFMEFLETVLKFKSGTEKTTVHLVTTEGDYTGEKQKTYLDKIKESCKETDIDFTWEFDQSKTIHARHIVTDHGWKIILDRGLDIFQHYEMNDAFNFENRLQQYRLCRGFEVTFIMKKGE